MKFFFLPQSKLTEDPLSLLNKKKVNFSLKALITLREIQSYRKKKLLRKLEKVREKE